MIAVIASVVVVLYVLVPGGLFRLITSFAFPVKNQKTRTQEFTFAVLFCLMPFCLTVILVWTVATWPFPTNEDGLHRRLAYRTVFVSLASDKQMDAALEAGTYWSQANSVMRRQIRFLLWYYLLVGLEAGYFSWLARQYQREGKRWRDWIARVAFRQSISEWAVLLTNFGSPTRDAHIELDVLSTEGVLYQGKLKDDFFNAEGDLAGVLLSGAARFDRDQYAAHRKADFEAIVKLFPQKPDHLFTLNRPEYWKFIPGADVFYIPRERVSNINVRHVLPDPDVPKAAEDRLISRNITGYIIETPTTPATG